MPLSKLPILFVLTLLSFVLPAFSDPLLGPPREIAPVRIDAAYGTRGSVATATNGNMSIVAWYDSNASKVLFNVLRRDGSFLTPAPREAGGIGNVYYSVVKTIAAASDGRNFLLVWIGEIADGSIGLRVATVRDDGDVTSIREIATTQPVHVSVAWNGSRYLVAYAASSINSEIHGVLLSRDGAVEGQPTRILGSACFSPSLASPGGDFLLVYRTRAVYALRLNGAGEWIAPPVILSSGSSVIYDNAVASNGTDYLVAWSEWTSSTQHRQIRARYVTHDGNPAESDALTDGTVNATSPMLAWTSAGYVVTYLRSGSEANVAEVVASAISTGLHLVNEQILDTSDGSHTVSETASAGGTTVTAWLHATPSHEQSYSFYESVFASIAQNGHFPPPVTVSTAAAQQDAVVAATNSAGTLVAWVERFGPAQERKVRAQFDSRLGAEPMRPHDTAGEQTAPAVAASPNDFLLAWVEHSGSGASLSVRRMDGAGVPIDASPTTIATDVDPGSKLAAIWGGGHYAVAFESVAGRIKLALLEPAAIPVVQVSPPRAYYRDHRPLLAFDGLQYLVVWTDEQPHDCHFECPMSSDVRAARVSRDGQLLDSDPPQVLAKYPGQAAPAVVWDGQEFVIASADLGKIVARRLRRDGTFLDSINGITLTKETAGAIDLRFDGATFTLAAATGSYALPPRSRILLKSFESIDAAFNTPFVVTDLAASQFVVMTPSEGRLLFAEASRLEGSPYFGATRVLVSTGSTSASDPLPPPAAVWAFGVGQNVMVQWQDRSDDETGFVLEDRGSYGYVPVAEAAANQTVAFLTGVAYGDHWYRVIAVRNGEQSEGSDGAPLRLKMRHRAVRR